MTTTITLNKVINTTDLFNAVIGSDFYGCTDYVVPRSLDYNEEKQIITCKYFDVANALTKDGYYKERNKTITIKQLANAYQTLLQNNQTHCGGHSLNVDDYDGCFGYLVLQQAIYGELHF
jgi:hypothetical protein